VKLALPPGLPTMRTPSLEVLAKVSVNRREGPALALLH
jgi:hypothetical protein